MNKNKLCYIKEIVFVILLFKKISIKFLHFLVAINEPILCGGEWISIIYDYVGQKEYIVFISEKKI